MNLRNPIIAAALLAIAGLGIDGAHAANGRPFVEIQGELVEVQGAVADIQTQIDDLIGWVETVEERLDAERTLIVRLEAEVAELSAAVEANEGDVDAAMLQIDNNIAMIEELQASVMALEEAVQMKQDFLDGKCSDGYALQAIQPDGSIVCEEVTSGGMLRTVQVVNRGAKSGHHGFIAEVNCPVGYHASGGGFDSRLWGSYGANLIYSRPSSNNGWTTYVSGWRLRGDLYVYAMCVAL